MRKVWPRVRVGVAYWPVARIIACREVYLPLCEALRDVVRRG